MDIETRAVFELDDLEVRQGGRQIAGSFRYGITAVRSDRGKIRKERFSSHAFGYVIDGEGRQRDLDLLVGHDFGKVLARRNNGTLTVSDTDGAMSFVADLPVSERQPTYMKDTVLMLENKSFGGLSPGFRVPSNSVVANAEELIPEPGNPGVFIRQVNHAVLHEISLVTRPSYPDTVLDLRSEDAARRDLQHSEELLRWL